MHRKTHYPPKKRTNPVIHVTIGIHQVPDRTNSNSHLILGNRKVMSNTQSRVSKPSLSQPTSNTNSSQKPSLLLKSLKMNSHHEINKKESSDKRGVTIDYHQTAKPKKKTKCTRRSVIASSVICLLVTLIAAIILTILLIKLQSTGTQSLRGLTPVLRWNKTGITVAGLMNNPGSGTNQLNTPYDIALDYANNMYVADRVNNRTLKFLFGNSIGQTVAGNLTAGLTPYQLYFPSGVVVDSNENLYIADSYNNRVQVWSPGSVSGTRLGGAIANPSNAFSTPYGLSLDPISDKLYVLDRSNNRVMSFASIQSNGTLVLGGINGPGPNKTQLPTPLFLHYDFVSNSLIVSNNGAYKVIRYVLGADAWTLVAGNSNGSAGATSTSLNNPGGVTMDPMGHIYVADANNNRIQFFESDLCDGITIAGFSGLGNNNATTLFGPRSVRLDSQLNLYVADTFKHRIQKFLRY